MITFQFVADHFDELEADFQREYGIDLRDALWGDSPVGGRRLTALINGLSPRSATMRRLQYGGSEWGNVEEMLATLIEQMDMANRMYYQVHFEGEAWDALLLDRPYPTDRGADTPKPKAPRKQADAVELRGFFGTMAAGDSTHVEPLAAKFPDCPHTYVYFDQGAHLERCQLCNEPVDRDEEMGG